ncbi:MAG: dethiobiotin synthase [Chlamydiia bacterium]|nr:dethiobiotin synthase [Chlamydiia bacterium]
MDRIVVAGIGTNVGKTVVSAILVHQFQGNYWKPIQTGIEYPDAQEVARLVDPEKHHIFPSAYSLREPVSPHHAARLEDVEIDPMLSPPQSDRPLVIEMVGGIYVPLSNKTLSLELFRSWDARWVVVSRHYIGSINHTLLTLETLKAWNVPVMGIVFNGVSNPDTENVILSFSKLPLLGHLLPEKEISPKQIKRYAELWKRS